jgi:hypothetical protein
MKKQHLKLFFFTVLASLFFVQCKKDERDINLNLSEVGNIFTPVDGRSIQIKPTNSNTVETFEWETAKAEDGSLVLYEVAFDQENGDFSKPFYKIVSDGNGVNNKLSISYGALSNIAKLGGVEFFQKKKFKWTVYSSKGTNVKRSPVSRTIEIERPGGFDVLPGNLYISGTATENGATLANAAKMKQVSPGVFEIFTKLKAGTYKFYDGNSGTPRQFNIYEEAGAKLIGVNGETTFAGADKIVRLRLDFNTLNTTQAEIKSLQLWYSPNNIFWFTLPYVGNGVWRYNGFTVALKQEGWGIDDRHKYKMVYNDGTGDKDLWLNYSTNDSPGQDGQWPHTATYKTINMTTNNSSQYDWTWKFDRNYLHTGDVADFWVSLTGGDAPYTVNYQKQ